MRVFICEWKKLISFRLFWVMCICAVLVNGYIQIERTNDRYYTPESYRCFFSEIEGLSLAETQEYLNDLIAQQNVGTDTSYPMYLLYDMTEIAEACKNYPAYLSSIAEQAETMSSVAIWGGKDTFSFRNIQKTPSAYAELSAKELPLAPSFGLENTFSSPLTDCIGIFLVLMVVCAVILKDRECGMMALLYVLPNGRQQLVVKKLLLIAVCTIGIAFLLFGENLLIGGALYGLGDLSRPIQSVYGYYQCNLPISVLEYLVLFFLLKAGSYLLFAAVFSLVCILVGNNLMTYFVSGVFCGISFFLYHCIAEHSMFSLLHFLNPVQLTQVDEMYSSYRNINLFSYPLSLKISALVYLSAALLLITGIAVLASSRNRIVQYRTISLHLFQRTKRRAHSRFSYTCYRSLILQKGIVLVIAAVFAAGLFCTSMKRAYQNDDIYYRNFTERWQGEITADTLQFLEEKEANYEMTEQQIVALQSAERINVYQLNLLSSELNDRNAFIRFQKRVEAIRNSEEEGKLFYDTGYERFFGMAESHEDMVIVLLMMLFLIFMLSPFAAIDQKNKMIRIIRASKAGTRGYWTDLMLYSAVCGAFISLLLTIPYGLRILELYGTQGLSEPIQSMTLFSDMPFALTIGGMMVLLLTVRTMGAVVTAMLMSIVSSLSRSPMTAYLVNLGVFALPAGIVLLGVTQFRYFGSLSLLSFETIVKMLTI